MSTLYETMRLWADGQNALNAAPAEERACLGQAVSASLGRLRLQRSLADLAASYLSSGLDQPPWSLIAQEFVLHPDQAEVVLLVCLLAAADGAPAPAPQRRSR